MIIALRSFSGAARSHCQDHEDTLPREPERHRSGPSQPADATDASDRSATIDNHRASKKYLLQAANFSYLGIFFGVALVIGYAGGSYVDRRLHTAPWFMMLGIFCGIAASFKELFRLARRFQRQSARDAADRPPGDAMTSGSPQGGDGEAR